MNKSDHRQYHREGERHKLIIAVDDLCILDRPTGIEVYTRALADYLHDTMAPMTTVARLGRGCGGLNQVFRTKLARWLLLQPFAICKVKADIFVFANFPPSPLSALLLRWRGSRVVRVIHDTVPWEMPEFTTRKTLFIFRMLDQFFMSIYDDVLTVSEYSEDRLKRIFHRHTSKIRNGGQLFKREQIGVNAEGQGAAARVEYEYFLHVGTVEPRKNIGTVLSALARCSGTDFKIVIAGRAGWGAVDYPQMARDLGVGDRVVFLDYVDEATLGSLYRDALGLLLPSHYEGFGMPIVEAMAYGLPVLAARNSAITEVVGAAGELIDTTDVKAWAAAMRKVAGEPGYRHALHRRSAARFLEIMTEQRRRVDCTWSGMLTKVSKHAS